jgi:crotonobetainyl-CoA:carnitine CoA-transferase CaiB-like acyl-CoA transferase
VTSGGPLAGVRVIEIGLFAAAPACGAVLADWGADVIKLEPLKGDAAQYAGRRRPSSSAPGAVPRHPRYELHNRSKRSVAVDLDSARGPEIARRTIAAADVFVTNMRLQSLERFGLDYESLRREMPALVYAHLTAYGLGHSAQNRRSWDHGAYWSMSGVAHDHADRDGVPPQPGGGTGDRVAGTALAGGIAAALLERERTGAGQLVTTSLLGTGLWMNGSEASDVLRGISTLRKSDRRVAMPTVNVYRSSEGRWFWLMVMDPLGEWEALLAAIDAPHLRDDERFGGGDPQSLFSCAAVLVEELDRIFATRTFDEWAIRFDERGLAYAPVLSTEEAVGHPLASASGAIVEAVDFDGSRFPMVDTPVRFGTQAVRTLRNAPRTGSSTRAVLAELGYQDDEIRSLQEAGAIASEPCS